MTPAVVPLLLAVTMACGSGSANDDATFYAADYLPPAGRLLELIPEGEPTLPSLFARVGDDTWELRSGFEWDEAQAAGTVSVDTDDGLSLDGELVLPASFSVGATSGAVTVTAVGQRTVWYGTFSRVASVEQSGGGAWGGEHAFAEGHGPVRLTWQGGTWELAGYEDGFVD